MTGPRSSRTETSEKAAWIAAALGRFEGSLIRYATRIVGDSGRARDVVQDTFLELWRADEAAVSTKLAPWLYTVCRNRALDVARKEQRMQPSSQLDALPSRGSPEAPHTAAVRHQSAQQVLDALEGLPERQQEVVALKFREGLSYREIAEVMELSVSNVGYLLHTALAAVREQVGGEA